MKIFKIISATLIFLVILIISFLEIDAYLYQNKISKMKTTLTGFDSIQLNIAHKTLAQDQYDLHYFISGKENEELIIFLHPAFSDHTAFDQQVAYFSKKYCVITIDMVGHGLSKVNGSNDKIDISAKQIDVIMQQEGFEKAHLIGVSMGSLIAQYFSFCYPKKTLSLVAVGGYDIHKENKEVEKAQRSSNLGLIFRALFSMNSFRKKTAEITCHTEKGQRLFYHSSKLYERKSFLVMQGLQNIIKDRQLPPMSYKTLILTGEHDIPLAHKMAKEWHSSLPNSLFKQINNAGHCAQLDQPDVFNEIVDQFIQTK